MCGRFHSLRRSIGRRFACLIYCGCRRCGKCFGSDRGCLQNISLRVRRDYLLLLAGFNQWSLRRGRLYRRGRLFGARRRS